MRLTVQELEKLGFSAEAIKRLQQKARGGSSGALGVAYQRRYALTRVAELAALQHLDTTVVVDADLCPVDDVVLERGAHHEHAQCKTSVAETWAARNHRLTSEFLEQQRILSPSAGSFRLLLVVADAEQARRLTEAMPPTLQANTVVECVPLPDPLHHAWRTPRLAQALDDLLPRVLRSPADRERLFKELNHAGGEPWVPTTVRALLEKALENPRLPLVRPRGMPIRWAVPRSEVDKLVGASWLGAVADGLELRVEGGVCTYYRTPTDSGFLARCDTPGFRRFVEAVAGNPPGTMREFLQVLPR